jgi:hypothetical protein
MGADKPVEAPTSRDDFQKVIRHFVTTPHKPHSPLGATPKTKRSDNAKPKSKKSQKLRGEIAG